MAPVDDPRTAGWDAGCLRGKRALTPDTAAADGGLKAGDVIVAINGEPVASFLDLKLLMMDQAPGNEVELTVSRDRFFGGKQTESVKFALVAGRS